MSSPLLTDRPWQTLGLDAHAINPVHSMITEDESLYLHWLARDLYTGQGAIVDAGPLLGGSTVAMAEGLRRNRRVADEQKVGSIHSYDLFTYYPFMSTLFDGDATPTRGDSLLPRFMAATDPWRSSIQVYPGDIAHYSWTNGPIEILFIDLAKTWDLQAHLLREFFPHLIPGVSIVVQQDYFFYGTPWIQLVMEYLSDYFTPVHVTDGPTLGFALEKPVPPELLRLDYEHLFSRREALDLMDRAAARFTGAKHLTVLTSKASLMILSDDIAGAESLLETIRRSPHFGPGVYFDFADMARTVVASMQTPGNAGAITEGDATFLRDLIGEIEPNAAIEIREGAADEQSALLVDTLAAPTRHVRIEGDVLYAFSDKQALDARRALAGRQIPLVILNGRRHHPWPAATLLALLPVLAPGAWVVLRDIRLPLLDTTGLLGHGPRYLFETWPGETRRGGNGGNIGAIRLPQDLGDVPAIVARALDETWEVLPPHHVCVAVGLTPDPVSSSRMHGVPLMQQATMAGRPLYLWGAGQSGRKLLDLLRHHDVPVAGFVDRNAKLHGTSVEGLIVESPDALDRLTHPRPYVAVSGVFAKEMAASLRAVGWVRNDDYAVM